MPHPTIKKKTTKEVTRDAPPSRDTAGCQKTRTIQREKDTASSAATGRRNSCEYQRSALLADAFGATYAQMAPDALEARTNNIVRTINYVDLV